MKKILFRILSAFLLVLMFITPILNIKTTALETDEKFIDRAGAVYLYNLENDKVLFEKNIDLTIFPASTVKIMTGYIAIINLKDKLNDTVLIKESMLNGIIGNRMGIVIDEVISVKSLLYGAICGGYNDAANVLACHISGSVEAFVSLMNETAKDLGMHGTLYKNPTGLHDYEMVTTLRDIVILSKAAKSETLFMEISSMVSYTLPATNKNLGHIIYNRNELIATNYTKKYFNANAEGLNAGSTTEGGYCVVTTISKDALTYLCVVMNADEDTLNNNVYSYIIANYLLNKALADYGYVEVIKQYTKFAQIDVALSLDTKSINLVASQPASVYMNKTYNPDDLKYSITTEKKKVNAPVNEGDELAQLVVYYNNEIIATSPLVAESSAKSNTFLVVLNFIKNIITSFFFIVFISSFCTLSVAYFLFSRFKKPNKYKIKRY